MKQSDSKKKRAGFTEVSYEDSRQNYGWLVPGDEYLSLLSRYNQNLIDLYEKLRDIREEVAPDAVFELLFSNLENSVCITDLSYRIVYTNSSWNSGFGSDTESDSLKDFLAPEDFAEFEKIRHQTNNFSSQRLNCMYLNESREYLCILPFSSGKQHERYLMIFQFDKSAMLPAPAEKLGSSDFGYHLSLLQHFEGFILVLDRKGQLKYLSDTIEKYLGIDAKLYGPSQFRKLVRNISLSEARKLHEQVQVFFEYGTVSPLTMDVHLLDINKQCRWFTMKVSEIETMDNLLISFSDIHERKIRELELKAERDLARHNDTQKSEFLANMSHEIRTPLNGIVGFSTMLDREKLHPDKKQKYLRLIRSSTTQLLSLINDIIDVSKIEAGQLKIRNKNVNLGALLDELKATFTQEAAQAGKSGLAFIRQPAAGQENQLLYTDDVRLRQVFMNLLHNSLKFTDEGEIEFGYYPCRKKEITFFVKDTGTGIPKSAMKHIFSRFQQSREGGKPQYEGTGLGLAISKGIVELLGGTIEAHSEWGKGTEFRFTLPFKTESGFTGP